MHPAPGATGRPSYAALVASIDSHACKYIAQSKVQESRMEMIAELKDMSKVNRYDLRFPIVAHFARHSTLSRCI
jgi:hypothetical protein